MKEQIDPGLFGIAVTAILMGAMLLAARASGHALLKKGLWAAFRATAQLFAAGYALNAVFSLDHSLAVVAVIVVMLGVAAFTGARQVESAAGRSVLRMALVLGTITGVLLLISLRLALGLPDLSPRYAIPLGGILLGNTMTAATLCANRYLEHLQEQRGVVETCLSLGASPSQADLRARKAAFRTAITPVFNAMMVVGVVKLPGIMSGQILGGSSPLISAKYQLVVLLLLAAGDGFAALWTLRWLRSRAFNDAWQLKV